MELLTELKSQWTPGFSPSSSHLDEYGATLASWLLENASNQLDVESVLSGHLLSNDALLDHCSWEILPILCSHRWMYHSNVRLTFVLEQQISSI